MSLYPPPATLKAEVFTRMPDRLRKRVRTPWSDFNKAGQISDCFLEGPSFDGAGNLWLTDIPHGRVFRVSPGGDWTQVAEYDGWPNGLKLHKDGRAFMTDYKRGIMVLDPATGNIQPLLETVRSESFKSVNDLHFAANGDLFFTDQGQTGLHDPTGRVYRYTADGSLTCLVDTVPSPNGLVLDLHEKVLFVAVTRANAVWRIPRRRDEGGCGHPAFRRAGWPGRTCARRGGRPDRRPRRHGLLALRCAAATDAFHRAGCRTVRHQRRVQRQAPLHDGVGKRLDSERRAACGRKTNVRLEQGRFRWNRIRDPSGA